MAYTPIERSYDFRADPTADPADDPRIHRNLIALQRTFDPAYDLKDAPLPTRDLRMHDAAPHPRRISR